MSTQQKPVKPPLYQFGRVPDARGLDGTIINIQNAAGVVSLYTSNGVSWVQVGAGGGAGTVTAVANKAPDGTGNVALAKSDIGLALVDNTPDATKPASTQQLAAMDSKIAALIGGAPGALDTIAELANALGADPNFATTILNSLAGKVSIANLRTVGGQSINGPGSDIPVGGGSAPTRTAFTNPVPLNAYLSMDKSLTSETPIALTAATSPAVSLGGLVEITFKRNGYAAIPTVPGTWKQLNGTPDYDATADSNTMVIWVQSDGNNGLQIWYAWQN